MTNWSNVVFSVTVAITVGWLFYLCAGAPGLRSECECACHDEDDDCNEEASDER